MDNKISHFLIFSSSSYSSSLGYYMYIEVSRKNKGDNAILLSRQQASGSKCLSFWYHMYGPHVDKLMISTSSNSKRGPTLWQRSGTQGNQWLNSNVTINANTSLTNYQVIISLNPFILTIVRYSSWNINGV